MMMMVMMLTRRVLLCPVLCRFADTVQLATVRSSARSLHSLTHHHHHLRLSSTAHLTSTQTAQPKQLSTMHPNVPLVLRLLASSHSISQKAGSIIRDIMHSGQLNIVDKVFFLFRRVFEDVCDKSFVYVHLGLQWLANWGGSKLAEVHHPIADESVSQSVHHRWRGQLIVRLKVFL